MLQALSTLNAFFDRVIPGRDIYFSEIKEKCLELEEECNKIENPVTRDRIRVSLKQIANLDKNTNQQKNEETSTSKRWSEIESGMSELAVYGDGFSTRSIKRAINKKLKQTSPDICDCDNCKKRSMLDRISIATTKLRSIITEISNELKRQDRNNARREFKKESPTQIGNRDVTVLTRKLPTTSATDIVAGKILTRLENIINSGKKPQKNELDIIKKDINGDLQGSSLIAQLQEKYTIAVALLSEKENNKISVPKNIAPESVAKKEEVKFEPSLEQIQSIKKAELIFDRFKKHIGIISSTNHSGKNSKGDGGFWHFAILPILNFTINSIRNGKIDPESFSWQKIATMHSENVKGRMSTDFLAFKQGLAKMNTEGSFGENILLMPTIVDSLVKNSAISDPIIRKGYIPLLVLREYLKSFELPKV